MAVERAVWYLWAKSLILAIPNNSGQLDFTCEMCRGRVWSFLVQSFENGCWKNAPQRYCESFIKIISPQVQNRTWSQTWNINKNVYTWDLSLQGSHMFLDVHVTKWQSDWPELLEMARTKEPPPIYQTTLFVTIHFVSGSGRMGTRLLH